MIVLGAGSAGLARLMAADTRPLAQTFPVSEARRVDSAPPAQPRRPA